MAKIGQKLRELRSRRQLSVRVLAERSGVSHSTISLMERDSVSPTLDTLQAVLDAMGSTLTGFLSDIEKRDSSSFYRPDDQPEIGNEEGISYRIIGVNHPNRNLLFMKETYRVGADTGKVISHEAQEAGYVVSGTVELTIGTRIKELHAGDAYYFDSREPHRFRNTGKTEAIILSAVAPPTY